MDVSGVRRVFLVVVGHDYAGVGALEVAGVVLLVVPVVVRLVVALGVQLPRVVVARRPTPPTRRRRWEPGPGGFGLALLAELPDFLFGFLLHA